MIATQDLYKEINIIEEVLKSKENISDDDYRRLELKLGVLNLKLLQNLRTNSVKVMRKLGIPLESKRDAKEKEE